MTATVSGRSSSNSESSQQQQIDVKQQEEFAPTRDKEKYIKIVNNLKSESKNLRSDREQPNILERPTWFNEQLFENAKSVYARHFMAINFAHLSGLLLLVRVHSIFRTLSATGKSDSVSKLFNRYYQTVKHVKNWYESDIFDQDSDAYRSLLMVRGMHNKVSSTLNDVKFQQLTNGKSRQSDENSNLRETSEIIDNASDGRFKSTEDESQLTHLSQYDLMITQFAFVGFIVMKAKSIGLIEEFSEHDLKSLLHFWRVIGYYLGAKELYNLCSRELVEIQGFCDAITDIEYKKSIEAHPISSPPGIMGINVVRSLKFIPMLTIYGIHKYLYDLLDIKESEFEPEKASRYARLSNTLIRWVMKNLLAYKVLRMFNNGLTRLSIFLVGKVQNWFTTRLESKYGQELRPL